MPICNHRADSQVHPNKLQDRHQYECGLPNQKYHIYVGLQEMQSPIYWREAKNTSREVFRTPGISEEQTQQ